MKTQQKNRADEQNDDVSLVLQQVRQEAKDVKGKVENAFGKSVQGIKRGWADLQKGGAGSFFSQTHKAINSICNFLCEKLFINSICEKLDIQTDDLVVTVFFTGFLFMVIPTLIRVVNKVFTFVSSIFKTANKVRKISSFIC